MINRQCIVQLPEGMQSTHLKIHSALQPDDAKYSLDYRQPGNHEGKNRRLGAAIYIFPMIPLTYLYLSATIHS